MKHTYDYLDYVALPITHLTFLSPENIVHVSYNALLVLVLLAAPGFARPPGRPSLLPQHRRSNALDLLNRITGKMIEYLYRQQRVRISKDIKMEYTKYDQQGFGSGSGRIRFSNSLDQDPV